MFVPHTLQPAALRGYWVTLLIAAGSNLGDPALFLLWGLLGVLRVVLLLSIWRMVLDPGQVVGGMTVDSVLTYTLIGAVFASQLDVRTDLTETIWSGAVVSRYLQPIGVAGLYAAELAGHWLFALATFSLPLLLAAPLLGVDPRPASLVHGFASVLSLGLGITVGLALDFIYGALLMIFRENLWTLSTLRSATVLLFSGALLPLQLYPGGIGDWFAWLPFAAMASAPLRIYTATGEPLPLLLLQLAWALALWPLAQSMWRANRERMVVAGG